MAVHIRDIDSAEHATLGSIMVKVYSELKGFPTPQQQPEYYQMLQNIGSLTQKPNTQVLVALDEDNQILGGVVYFSDMAQYGSGGTATSQKQASGIRLLAVRSDIQGGGVGKALTHHCIELAKTHGNKQVILHTTQAMQIAWGMYQRMGFVRDESLDFSQGELAVFGFRLELEK